MEHPPGHARAGLVLGTRLNGVPSPSRPGSYCRTLTELAERVGVSIVNLSVLKNNRAKVVRFSTLTAICEVLDCEVGDVLGLRPSPAQIRSCGSRGPALTGALLSAARVW